jgi:hypothetical protein
MRIDPGQGDKLPPYPIELRVIRRLAQPEREPPLDQCSSFQSPFSTRTSTRARLSTP